MESAGKSIRLILAKISGTLSAPRPVRVVRRVQFLLIGFTLIIITVVLTYPVWNESMPDLKPGGAYDTGKLAPDTVIARTEVEFPRNDLFEESKKSTIVQIPYHFERNFGAISGTEGKTLQSIIADELTLIQKCREKSKNEIQLVACSRSVPGFARLKDPRGFLYMQPQKLAAKATEAAQLIFENVLILPVKYTKPAEESTALTVEVRDIGPNKPATFKSLPLESVLMPDQMTQEKTRQMLLQILTPISPDIYVRTMYLDFVLSDLIKLEATKFLPEDTENARKEAVGKLSTPVMRIAAGEVIVRSGEIIRPENRTALEEHKRFHFREVTKRIVAIFIQQLILLSMLVYFAYRFQLKRMSEVTANLVFFLNVWLFCAVLFVLQTYWTDRGISSEHHIFGAWVPVGLFSVIFAILSSELFALASAVYLSMLVFGVSQYDPQSFIYSFIMSLTATWCGSLIRKRIHFLAASFVLGALSVVLVGAVFLYENKMVISQMGGDLLNASYKEATLVAFLFALSTAFAIVLLPVYESVFNVPTRFRLQELSDPSNRLLQEFYRLAPSTWNHTLMVASLTEKACERLSLNTLLARTGVYYHDIGKMKRAGFFVENQHLIPRPENIDKNNPEKAARVIIDHVLDGLEMARQIRLPREVMAFIPEHHGTSTMSFFYHQALEKSKRRIKRDNFRYPGPRPQSKETGIVMIADSVEAASRSLPEVTEAAVDAMIQRVISMKLAENQLDESGLTLGDLNVVRESFRDVLLSSLHSRPRYPAMEATKKLEDSRR